jgi:hypothetical protein
LKTRVLSEGVHHGQNQIAGVGFANRWQQHGGRIDWHPARGECPGGALDSLNILVFWNAFDSHKKSLFHNVIVDIRLNQPRVLMLGSRTAAGSYQEDN